MLSPDEQRRITERVARLEAATGAQVVAAAVGKSDSYPEIPWKAFALGAALAALGLAGGALAGAGRAGLGGLGDTAPVIAAGILLAAGALAALLTVLCPPAARLFLDAHRAEAEVRQHAESLFRAHGLDRTRARVGVLLLVSLFERRVYVLPDVGVRDRLAAADLAAVAAGMTGPAARGRVADALLAGLAALEAALAAAGLRGAGGPDEIADTVVQEPGE